METLIASNTQTVQKCFDYFKAGNIPALLNELDENITWHTPGPVGELPWAGDREGKAAVGSFFTIVNENMDILKFEPTEFFERGNRVVALGTWEAKARKTGKTVASDWAMAFTFKNDKVVRFQEYTDTAAAVSMLK